MIIKFLLCLSLFLKVSRFEGSCPFSVMLHLVLGCRRVAQFSFISGGFVDSDTDMGVTFSFISDVDIGVALCSSISGDFVDADTGTDSFDFPNISLSIFITFTLSGLLV